MRALVCSISFEDKDSDEESIAGEATGSAACELLGVTRFFSALGAVLGAGEGSSQSDEGVSSTGSGFFTQEGVGDFAQLGFCDVDVELELGFENEVVEEVDDDDAGEDVEVV